MKNDSNTPRWETAVLALSFALVWAWFLARQAAVRQNLSLPLIWNAVLPLALLALIVVLIRRLKRVVEALRSVHPARRDTAKRN